MRRKKKGFEAVFLASFFSAGTLAANAVGIAGGTKVADAPYAVLLPDFSGSVLPISGLPSTGVSSINAVDINSSGLSLIGGRNDSAAYASFVTSDGTLIPITLGIPTGQVLDLAINSSGLGLLGVQNIGGGSSFAAFVTSDGTVTSVPISPGDIRSVGLNDAGVGLIGGEGTGAFPYADFVTSDGTITNISLSTLPDFGHTKYVAINSSGNGILGAFTFSGDYTAFVYSDATSLVLTFPRGGSIHAVAINNSGIGLIGGQGESSNAYVQQVALDGTVTPLISSPFSGTIYSVAINDAGVSLFGGDDGAHFYAALYQSGTLTPLFTTPEAGTIGCVAINAAGVGLIGGQFDSGAAYAALVAPNGTLTPLTLSGTSISSVALTTGGSSIIDQVVPTTSGPYSSAVYTQLAVANALETRFHQQNRVWGKNENSSNKNIANRLEANLALSPKVHAEPKQLEAPIKPNSFWFEPFGSLVYLKEEGAIPKYNNQLAGGIIGYDRQGANYIVGGSGGYVFNYVALSSGLGHAKVQEEVFSVYGAWYSDHFWFDLALSAGPYQVTNIRHFLTDLTAKGKFHGWLFDPHFELATPWAIGASKRYYVEPFAQFDWVNNWQHKYTETGATGFNLQVPSVYSSLLQSELGLRFYEQFVYGWGKVCLSEKVSYINQAPFNINPTSVSFVSSPSSFPVALAGSQNQNLGSAELLVCFVPQNPARPYGGFTVQGTAGSSYQSVFGNLFLGIDF